MESLEEEKAHSGVSEDIHKLQTLEKSQMCPENKMQNIFILKILHNNKLHGFTFKCMEMFSVVPFRQNVPKFNRVTQRDKGGLHYISLH